jgi:hypothetical protein
MCTIRCIGIYALGVLYQTRVVRKDKIGHEEQGSKHKLDSDRFMATERLTWTNTTIPIT